MYVCYNIIVVLVVLVLVLDIDVIEMFLNVEDKEGNVSLIVIVNWILLLIVIIL